MWLKLDQKKEVKIVQEVLLIIFSTADHLLLII